MTGVFAWVGFKTSKTTQADTLLSGAWRGQLCRTQHASLMTHTPPLLCTPGPLRGGKAKSSTSQSFCMTPTWMLGWGKNNVSAQKTEQTQRDCVPGGSDHQQLLELQVREDESKDAQPGQERKSVTGTAGAGTQGERSQRATGATTVVGAGYLSSMETSASTLITDLSTSLATKTSKSCQQTAAAHGWRACSGVFHQSSLSGNENTGSGTAGRPEPAWRCGKICFILICSPQKQPSGFYSFMFAIPP